MDWILVVEDEPAFRSFLSAVLQKEGYGVDEVANGDDAVAALKDRRYALVLTDLRMPGLDGMEVLRHVRQESPETEVIVLTAFGTIASAVEAMKVGAADYLTKPLENPDQLRILVRKVLERQRLEAERDALAGDRQDFPGFLYQSPAMARVVELIRALADNEATVLLSGESGSGKEVVARAIHRVRHSEGGPFVAINCAAMPENLLESQLFGHERGAFTGATERLRGKFELAHGGTLFLDEIGELPLHLQAKLLRVLETRDFERVGGTARIHVDLGLIAATNRDLSAQVARGEFRKDLYYRLMVFPIEIPPLRQRREDILPLARHFLADIARNMKRPPLSLSSEAEKLLLNYPWPGNVRELHNVLERATILGKSTLDPSLLLLDPTAAQQLLPPEERDPSPAPSFPSTPSLSSTPSLPSSSSLPSAPLPPSTDDEDLNLKEIERRAIAEALERTGGDRKATAELLGISLRTLQYRLREYDLKGR